MPISVMNNQTCITPQSFHKKQQNFTANSKVDDSNGDTFSNRAKNEYKKETNTTLGKILFWTGTIGLLAAFIGPAVFKK